MVQCVTRTPIRGGDRLEFISRNKNKPKVAEYLGR